MQLTVEPVLLNQSFSNFPASTFAWQEVARVCRRICILRERGHALEAERIRTTELAELIAVRTRAGDEPDVEARLSAIFAAEEERVANAAVVAELLLPLLAQELRAGFPIAQGSGVAPRSEPPTASPAPAPASPPPGLTDLAGFIDQMIAQDDAGLRRAS